MTLTDTLGLSDERERLLTRAMQLFLGGLFVYGLVTLQFGIAMNGGVALAVTLVPALIRREYRYSMDIGLVLWITVAMMLNSIGALGLYTEYSWYDEVAHTVSATFIAGIGYAVLRAFEDHSEEMDVPPNVRGVFIVVFVVAFGVLWEVFEFASVVLAPLVGIEPPVAVYGIDDIVTDTIFNTVGAVIVALWGTDRFGGLVGFVRRRMRPESDGTAE
jgi:hypothetical protein